jgi:hypothetical protein
VSVCHRNRFEILIHPAMSGPKIGVLRPIPTQPVKISLPDQPKYGFSYTRMREYFIASTFVILITC